MQPSFVAVLSGIGLILLTHSAHAERFYVGAGIGATRYESDVTTQITNLYRRELNSVAGGSLDGEDRAWRIFVGYQLNPHLAIEGTYVDLGRPELSYTTNISGGTESKAEYKLTGYQIAVVGMLPLMNQLTIFGKLGMLRSQLKYRETRRYIRLGGTEDFTGEDNEQTKPLWGLGLQYEFNKQFAVRGEFNQYRNIGQDWAFTNSGNGKFESIDVYGISFLYRF